MLSFILVFFLVFSTAIYFARVRVPENYEYIVEHFGMYQRVLPQGTYWITPFTERIAYRVDMTPQRLSRDVSLVAEDGSTLCVTAMLTIQVHHAPKAIYGLENYEVGCLNLVEHSLHSILSDKSKEEILIILNADANDTSAEYKTFPQKKRRNKKGRRKHKKPDQIIKYNSPKYAMIKSIQEACVDDMVDWGITLHNIAVNLQNKAIPSQTAENQRLTGHESDAL